MHEERDLSSLPVSDHQSGDRVKVGISPLQQFPGPKRQLLHEIFPISPLLNAINIDNRFLVGSLQQGVDMEIRILDLLCSDHTFQHDVSLRIRGVVNDPWAIDEVDSSSQGDVLPDLRKKMRIMKIRRIGKI